MSPSNGYKRKTNRQSWNPEDMEKAIAAVTDKKMGWLKASQTYNVPQATLQRRANNKNKLVKGTEKGLGRFRVTFDPTFKHELVEYLFDMQKEMFGLYVYEIRELAYQLAEKNGLTHRFNHKKGMTGWHWWCDFRARHPNLSLHQPKALSFDRKTSFTKEAVQAFFEILKTTLDDNPSITASKIWNVDESGLSTM